MVFSSPEPKAHVSFSDQNLSVVSHRCRRCYRRRRRCRKLFTFSSYPPEPLSKASLGIQVCSNEGPRPSPRGDNGEIVKLYLKYLKSSSPEPLSKFQPNLTHCILG